MRHFALALSMTAAVMAARAVDAQTLSAAGTSLDHLVCYKMKDKLKLSATTDLIAQLQPDFTQRGCTIVKPIEFCVPATKLNVSPVPPDPNIAGTPLRNDFICYLAKCKSQVPPPDEQVIDQFGSRRQTKYKLSKICVPARKAPAGCPTGPLVKGTMCQGGCPDSTETCQVVKVGGVKQCQCAHEDVCGGNPDSAGQCGGDCPTPGDVCLPTLLGSGDPTTTKFALKCTCRPPTEPICSINAATGICGGDCPKPTDTCVINANGQCNCEPDNPPCQASTDASGALVCGGACPLTGQDCQPDSTTGKCSCQPPAGCGQDPLTGTCSGDCPNLGDVCALDFHRPLPCGPPPCGSQNTSPPSCGGACPFAAQQCALDATGACNCQPPLPCGPTGANTCGGFCPAPRVCRLLPGTTSCECQ